MIGDPVETTITVPVIGRIVAAVRPGLERVNGLEATEAAFVRCEELLACELLIRGVVGVHSTIRRSAAWATDECLASIDYIAWPPKDIE